MSLVTELMALRDILFSEGTCCSRWAFFYRQYGQLDLAHEHDGGCRVYRQIGEELNNILRRQEERENGKEGE